MNFSILKKRSFELLFLGLIIFSSTNISAQTVETIPSGSYVIDMGVMPQSLYHNKRIFTEH